MDFRNKLSILNTKVEDVCLADNATIHIIFQDKKYFLEVKLLERKVNIISSPIDLIEGSRRAILLLASETKSIIQNILYSIRSKRNLLSFKDTC